MELLNVPFKGKMMPRGSCRTFLNFSRWQQSTKNAKFIGTVWWSDAIVIECISLKRHDSRSGAFKQFTLSWGFCTSICRIFLTSVDFNLLFFYERCFASILTNTVFLNWCWKSEDANIWLLSITIKWALNWSNEAVLKCYCSQARLWCSMVNFFNNL